jgi:Putative peptidoglycan binding domain/IPT/TIG domain
MTNIKTILCVLITIVFAASIFSNMIVFAESLSSVNTYSNATLPTSFNTNLKFGSRGDLVKQLQNTLVSLGYLKSGLNTGYFGNATRTALKLYQKSKKLPDTGYFGPLTRTYLNKESGSTLPIDDRTKPTLPLTIRTVHPEVGNIGSTITINGTGFTSSNSIKFGSHIIQNVNSVDGTSLSFNVPEYINPCGTNTLCMAPAYKTTPGWYPVTVQNTKGISNSIEFAVATSSNTPSQALLQKQSACVSLGGSWNTSQNIFTGPTGTCLFSMSQEPGAKSPETFCKEWQGEYNMCLSTCGTTNTGGGMDREPMMCAAVCTPGCTNIK